LAAHPTGAKVSDAEFAAVQLQPAAFHGGDWNYAIAPHAK